MHGSRYRPGFQTGTTTVTFTGRGTTPCCRADVTATGPPARPTGGLAAPVAAGELRAVAPSRRGSSADWRATPFRRGPSSMSRPNRRSWTSPSTMVGAPGPSSAACRFHGPRRRPASERPGSIRRSASKSPCVEARGEPRLLVATTQRDRHAGRGRGGTATNGNRTTSRRPSRRKRTRSASMAPASDRPPAPTSIESPPSASTNGTTGIERGRGGRTDRRRAHGRHLRSDPRPDRPVKAEPGHPDPGIPGPSIEWMLARRDQRVERRGPGGGPAGPVARPAPQPPRGSSSRG